MFAAVPLVFAAQQAAEGVVWLTFDGGALSSVHEAAVICFLGVALVVWPAWLPWSLRRIETDRSRSQLLTALTAFGVIVAAASCVLLTRWDPSARVAEHSLAYSFGAPAGTMVHVALLVAYVLPMMVPFFVSTAPFARTIGLTFIVSLILAAIVQRHALTSVWCFFAAVLSVQVLIAVGPRAIDGR